jgi:hypothetical protein
VAPIELPPLLAKLDVEAVANADIPLPSARPPVTDRQVRALLRDETIVRAYLGTDPATASAADRRRARTRFGRPLGLPQVMPDGAVRPDLRACGAGAGRRGRRGDRPADQNDRRINPGEPWAAGRTGC